MIIDYLVHLFILIGIYFIVSIALQVSIGFTGILNLGHIAFFAIGAYVSALLSLAGFPFLFCFVMAGIITMIFGFLLALLLKNLKGDYAALVTLGFSFIIYAIILNWFSITRGPLGLPGISRPSFLGLSLASNYVFLILVIIVAITSYWIIKKITSSPFGKVLEATRDDELGIKVLGKNTFKIKVYSLGISAFFAGIAGSLYAHYISFIDPSSFTIIQLIPILCIVIIGGLTSLRGTFVATLILVLLPEILKLIGFPDSIMASARQWFYAFILILILIFKPRGLFGGVEIE
jgi:branched-chain amino acid transport system permease protein